VPQQLWSSRGGCAIHLPAGDPILALLVASGPAAFPAGALSPGALAALPAGALAALPAGALAALPAGALAAPPAGALAAPPAGALAALPAGAPARRAAGAAANHSALAGQAAVAPDRPQRSLLRMKAAPDPRRQSWRPQRNVANAIEQQQQQPTPRWRVKRLGLRPRGQSSRPRRSGPRRRRQSWVRQSRVGAPEQRRPRRHCPQHLCARGSR